MASREAEPLAAKFRESLVKLGKNLSESSPPKIPTTKGEKRFENNAAIVLANYIKANSDGYLILTAMAVEVIDVKRNEMVFQKVWKASQYVTPGATAKRLNMPLKEVLEMVHIHEDECGYFFVDRSPTARPVGEMCAEIERIADTCGQGCFLADATMDAEATERLESVLKLKFTPIPHAKTPVMFPKRTKDIVADLTNRSAILMRSLGATI
jgi:hypothetical protein